VVDLQDMLRKEDPDNVNKWVLAIYQLVIPLMPRSEKPNPEFLTVFMEVAGALDAYLVRRTMNADQLNDIANMAEEYVRAGAVPDSRFGRYAMQDLLAILVDMCKVPGFPNYDLQSSVIVAVTRKVCDLMKDLGIFFSYAGFYAALTAWYANI